LESLPPEDSSATDMLAYEYVQVKNICSHYSIIWVKKQQREILWQELKGPEKLFRRKHRRNQEST